MNSLPDSLIRPTAAQVAGHRIVDIRIAGIRIGSQQARCRHHLSGLAVAALWNLLSEPRLLNRMAQVRREPFNRRDLLTLRAPDRGHTGANGIAVQMHRTAPAERHAAAE